MASAFKKIMLPSGNIVSYIEAGDLSGDPVLFIHGWTGSCHDWSLLFPNLLSKRLIAIDLRGHGGSDAPEVGYSCADYAEDVKYFLDALKLKNIDIVGHSLGSMVAQCLCAFYPEYVRNLVLLGSAFKIELGPGTKIWHEIHEQAFPLDATSEFLKSWYWNALPVPSDFIRFSINNAATVPKHVWLQTLYNLSITDLTNIASSVSIPVLAIWGDCDNFMSKDQQVSLQNFYRKIRHITYEGGGHCVAWENPYRVSRDIIEFLK